MTKFDAEFNRMERACRRVLTLLLTYVTEDEAFDLSEASDDERTALVILMQSAVQTLNDYMDEIIRTKPEEQK